MLTALDFAGELVDVVSQPVRLAFETLHGGRVHTPDYLAVTRGGVWLVDVRPSRLIKPKDVESFAAAAEVALTCGWRYVVVGGWREHVPASLDALSSQRRPLSDPLGLGPGLLAAIGSGLLLLRANTPHPHAGNLIFHPPVELAVASAEAIVDAALAYRPIAL